MIVRETPWIDIDHNKVIVAAKVEAAPAVDSNDDTTRVERVSEVRGSRGGVMTIDALRVDHHSTMTRVG